MPTKSTLFTAKARGTTTTTGYGAGVVYHALDKVNGGSVTTSDSHKDWKKRIATGQSATTALEGVLTSTRFGNGVLYRSQTGTYAYQKYTTGHLLGKAVNDHNPSTANFSSTLTKATNIAVARLLKSYRSQTQSLQTGVSVAEGLRYLKFLTNPIGAITKSTMDLCADVRRARRALRGAGKRRTREVLSIAADRYLQYTYEVKPNMMDIQGALNAMDNIGKRPETVVVIGTGESAETGVLDVSPVLIIGSGLTNVRCTLNDTVKTSFKVKGVVAVDSANGVIRELGLMPEDFIPSVYELIPFSFMLDYFTNVNDLVDSYSLRSLNWRWIYSSQRSEYTRVWNNVRKQGSSPASTRYAYCSPSTKTFKYVKRTPLTEAPTPRFEFQLPTGKQLFNVGALATAMGYQGSRGNWSLYTD